jgi:rubrerythrin
MIFIAGISPKTKKIDQNPRRCPVCGLHQAYYQRVDHYFSLFFIPIIRVKKGEPFIMCARCQRSFNEFRQEFSPFQQETDLRCKFCNKPVDKKFSYCPYCGKRI